MHMPDAAAVHYLLGKLFQADREVKRAVDCYVEALELNPFMWDAFERLCDTGIYYLMSGLTRADSNRSKHPYFQHLQNEP